MAKKEVRPVIALACEECKNKNYSTTKNKKTTTDKLVLQKFCKFCRKVVGHKETK